MASDYRNWRVVQTVELGAPAQEVWDLVGGFFNIHKWHPDIELSEVPEDQTETSHLRRLLTFPGQPKTMEELIFVDNEDFHYRYKWEDALSEFYWNGFRELQKLFPLAKSDTST